MPIKSNNPQDAADSEKLCRQYGVNMITVPLGNILNEFIKTENITDTPMLSGNTASRLRMTVLYNIAGAKKYLVCGTSNKTEYMIGYSTKGGDSAADIQPIIHLYKKDVYKLADELEIPEEIIKKVPSAGFFEGQTDEDEIGMSYSDLDAALINLEINNYEPSNESEEKVLELIKKSSHKRMPPISVA
ncbi:MAG TPA: NAD(+) synthase, partial [Methanocorpusculum sp.]|nr:NAD(+) synthase [Methanocorpusculum sp.]